jgi:SpoVK/Ycf46/Vps4 family AAA+-type ATPase
MSCGQLPLQVCHVAACWPNMCHVAGPTCWPNMVAQHERPPQHVRHSTTTASCISAKMQRPSHASKPPPHQPAAPHFTPPRRLKTEFLVQFDGVASGDARIVVIGATNRPQELDDAVRRRLVKRIYIPLPDEATRRAVLRHLLQGQNVRMGGSDIEKVVRATDLYSASDLTALCKEAAMGPVRELGAAIAGVSADSLRPIQLADFSAAIRVIRPSTNMASVKAYEEFTEQYGTA